LWSEEEPRNEGDDRDSNHDRDEPFRDAVGEALDRCAAALSLADELYDAGEQGFGADALGAHDERAGAVNGCADDFAFGRFFYRHGFAGDHGFVDGAAAFEQDAVDGNLFSGADAQAVAGMDLFEGNVFFRNLATGPVNKQACGFGAEIEQGADGGAGAAAGAELHHLPKQDECGDGSGGFEINLGVASHATQRLWKNLRREGGNDAVPVGDAGTHADQGEHVGAAVDERSPEALEERQATPDDNRSG
jgi:hypothetical protein